MICVITGVPESALRGVSLSRFSDNERFLWIERRQTKVEEDKAYSLLGIFGVELPLRYGEGSASAFKRLEEEIDKLNKCLQDLRVTDPCDDKKRIEDDKGGLLKECCGWVFDDVDYQQWRNDPKRQLLWVKGDPGKGKTMLLCGIIDELEKSISKTALLSYFFCQATDLRINSATAVLRGLIFTLISRQPSLISHIREKYNRAGKRLFEDANAWVALLEIFTDIMQDQTMTRTYLVIDALDECVTDLSKLLNFIAQGSSIYPQVKWIVSSRNWPNIEKQLGKIAQNLSLELNAKSVSVGVKFFIQSKVRQLAQQNEYEDKAQGAIIDYLSSNANGTFLWVALVCKELALTSGWEAEKMPTEFPPELNALYKRMLDQIHPRTAKLCKNILDIVLVVYRPITLDELASFVDMPPRNSSDYKVWEEIVGRCGSFLTLRDRTISFVHQSAKDFLLQEASRDIFPFESGYVHYTIFSKSLQVMSTTLKRDVYSLNAPGISIDQVKQPDPDPLAAAQYSCLYWVDHLINYGIMGNVINDLRDGGLVDIFLRNSYLYWLEALSLMKSLLNGVIMILRLERRLQADESPELHAFIYDARRFAIYNRSVIEQTPLQSYCSALIFAPEKSIIRKTFEKCIPTWIEKKPRVQAHWSAALQTLEGHSGFVNSVAFSPDGKQVISGSDDNTVRIWDATTGAILQTLKGHSRPVYSVAFSPDGKQVVSGSKDNTVQLWDATTGAMLQTLKGHSEAVNSVAFLPDCKQVISGSDDYSVRLWDAMTGAMLQMLKGHSGFVHSVAFSPNGKLAALGSSNKTVQLWDVTTRKLHHTLIGHSHYVNSVAFSPNNKLVASGSSDKTVRLWDIKTGAMLQKLESHTKIVTSVSFSHDCKQVVSGSSDKTVKLWDTMTGKVLQTLIGHTNRVSSVAFSLDGKRVVSGSPDKTVQLWDITTGAALQVLEDHTHKVTSVAISPNGKHVVSGSYRTLQLWDTATEVVLQSLKGHTGLVYSVAFSPDGKKVVSGSYKIVRLWDTTGEVLQTLIGHSHNVNSVAFSPNNKLVASGSYETVQLWDATTGAVLQTLIDHSHYVNSVAFSPNSKLVASGSSDMTVQLWDITTGAVLQTLKGHSSHFDSVAFSPNGKLIVSGSSSNNTVELWDAMTGAALQMLKGHSGLVSSVAFSPDGKLLPTLQVVNHWLVEGATNLVWLPNDYRPTRQAVRDNMIVLGHSSGRVSFLQIKHGSELIISN